MNKKVLVSVLGAAAVIATIFSFVSVRSANDPAKVPARFDKAQLLFDRAIQMNAENRKEEAVSAFVAVTTQCPGSEYAERSLRELASIYKQKGDQAKANYYYGRLVGDFPKVEDAPKIKSEIEKLNVEKLMSPKATEDSIEYSVVKGDSLYGIAKKYNTTVAMLKKTNDLKSDVVRLGQKLKVNVGKFSIFVDKAKNILILKKDGQPFKTYTVSTGKGNITPVGTFTIVDKMVSPPWTREDGKTFKYGSKEYEIGTRWMALSTEGIGIHGTNDENSIGAQVTAGCVRMHNSDVEELYDIVPRGTEVAIVDGEKAEK